MRVSKVLKKGGNGVLGLILNVWRVRWWWLSWWDGSGCHGSSCHGGGCEVTLVMEGGREMRASLLLWASKMTMLLASLLVMVILPSLGGGE